MSIVFFLSMLAGSMAALLLILFGRLLLDLRCHICKKRIIWPSGRWYLPAEGPRRDYHGRCFRKWIRDNRTGLP